MTEYLDYLIQNPCLTLAAVFALTLLLLAKTQTKLSYLWLLNAIFVVPLALETELLSLQILMGIQLFLGIFIVSGIRKILFTKPLFGLMRKALPPIGETERIALEAGDVWWDAELFQGNPNWSELSSLKAMELTEEEQSFVDNEVKALCSMVNSYELSQQNDLPKEVWQYIADNGFWAINIAKKYGGKGFSHYAHAIIVGKVSSVAGVLGVSVMVPNSLGPGELLQKYGTDAQKDQYLPRLSAGKEIPCFALTSTVAGSDAGSLVDSGVVCYGEFEGKEVLGMRLNWEKRYITLAPVATVIGLAFKAFDPDNLLAKDHPLSGQSDLGITCALSPRNTAGVSIGTRHKPIGEPFQNGPIFGKDVFVPMDWLIGGDQMIGHGWRMLMECLSVGRGISLPVSGAAGTQAMLLTTSAYTQIREQFGLPIANLEGIQEKLATLATNAYRATANINLSTWALDAGYRPSIISAIVKYRNTSLMQQSAIDAMDVHGGRAVMQGPRNYVANVYASAPVAITVEGANILTRSLMVFGQGLIRCHATMFDELDALYDKSGKGIAIFDKALTKHVSSFLHNFARAVLFSWTRGRCAKSYGDSTTKTYYRNLSVLSAKFAAMSDISLFILTGSLKRKEMVSGRFADAIAAMYEMSACLKLYEERFKNNEKVSKVLRLSLLQLAAEVDSAMRANLDNLPVNWLVKKTIGLLLFPFSNTATKVDDRLIIATAKSIADIDWLTSDLSTCICTDLKDVPGHQFEILFKGYEAASLLKPLKKRVKKAGYKYQPSQSLADWLGTLVSDKLLTSEEKDNWLVWHEAVLESLKVDDFEIKNNI
jgi:acyl-CoA dehydrogenase